MIPTDCGEAAIPALIWKLVAVKPVRTSTEGGTVTAVPLELIAISRGLEAG
jgi:hypothetical protein